jgi:hypothetical protein
MMEAVSTYETSVNFYQTTKRNMSQDSHLDTSRRENSKPLLPDLPPRFNILPSRAANRVYAGAERERLIFARIRNRPLAQQGNYDRTTVRLIKGLYKQLQCPVYCSEADSLYAQNYETLKAIAQEHIRPLKPYCRHQHTISFVGRKVSHYRIPYCLGLDGTTFSC